MPFIHKITFYTFLLYPLLGYITKKYFGFSPYYIFSILVIVSFVTKFLIKTNLYYPKYLVFYTIYMFFLIISKYVVNDVAFAFDSHLAQIIYVLSAILLFLIIENTNFSDSFIRRSVLLMKYFVYIAALISIIQYYRPSFFLNTEEFIGYVPEIPGYARRIVSIFSWGDLMNSQYLSIGYMIIYGIIAVEYRENKHLSILIPILVGIVVFLSQYRIAMITYILVTITLSLRNFSLKSTLYIVAILLGLFFISNFLAFDTDYFLKNRLQSETAYSRIEAFRAFFYAFPEKPFFGTGGERTEALFEGFNRVSRLHNAHLGIAYYYGIFAFIFHTIFIVYIIKRTYSTGFRANYWPPFIGILCYLVATMTIPRGDFLEPGLAFMMVFNKYYFDRYTLFTRTKIYA